MGILDEQLHIEGASIDNDVKVISKSFTAFNEVPRYFISYLIRCCGRWRANKLFHTMLVSTLNTCRYSVS